MSRGLHEHARPPAGGELEVVQRDHRGRDGGQPRQLVQHALVYRVPAARQPRPVVRGQEGQEGLLEHGGLADDDEGERVLGVVQVELGGHQLVVPSRQEGMYLEAMWTQQTLDLLLPAVHITRLFYRHCLQWPTQSDVPIKS